MPRLFFTVIATLYIRVMSVQWQVLDPTFDEDGRKMISYGSSAEWITCLALLPDGRILCGGTDAADDNSGWSDAVVTCLMTDGTVDGSFGNNGVARADLHMQDIVLLDMVVDQQQRIVFVGRKSMEFMIGRFTADGSLDYSFGDNGFVDPYEMGISFNSHANSVDVMSDGSIVAGGEMDDEYMGESYSPSVIVHVEENGEADHDFGNVGMFRPEIGPAHTNHFFHDVRVDEQDRVLYIDSYYSSSDEWGNFREVVGRLTPDGDPDPSFHNASGYYISGPNHSLKTLTLLGDGSIIASGSGAPESADMSHVMMLKLDANGQLVPDFGYEGFVFHRPQSAVYGVNGYDVEEAADGSLYLGAYVSNFPSTEFMVAKFDAGGLLDTNYGLDGSMSTTNSYVHMTYGIGMALQSDGRVLMCGAVHDFPHEGMVVRFAEQPIEIIAPVVRPWQLFPNPASDLVRLQSPEELITHVRITDASGRLVLSFASMPTGSTLDISPLAAGVYHVVASSTGIAEKTFVLTKGN